MASKRTMKEIKQKLELAKLSLQEMIPLSQSLFFYPEEDTDLILIEMDAHLLEKVGTDLVIRGDPDDDLVLCSENRTYTVREAEISNSLLVIPELKFLKKDKISYGGFEMKQVLKTFHHYWEPKQIRPSARKLYRILEQNSFRGEEQEEAENQSSLKSTFQELLNVVQSSREELHSMLSSISAIMYKGRYRKLDIEYHFRLLEFVLSSIESNSMDFDKIDIKTIANEVSDLEPRSIVESFLSMYVSDEGLLNKNKVCITQAEALLRNAESFRLQDFFETWKQSLPDGFQPDVKCLYGIAYISDDTSSLKTTINYLSFWDLPEQESDRLQTLLRLKSAWRIEEIEPFIGDLTLQSVNSLLLKYARAFKRDGQVYYSKK